MSSLPLAIRRLERFGDHCNAIVVKEVRQSLKSRQFVGTFVLLLLVAWGGSIFGITMTGDSIEYGSSAEGFFILFFLILCVASLVIVPFAAFRSIVEERAENTLELVQITAMSPRQIVWGKSLSALVQVLVYFSAITPFIAFTSLLPGFDFVRTMFNLGILLVVSFAFSSVGLAIGAQTKNRISQAFGSLGVIVLAFIGLFMFASFTFQANLSLGEASTWWGIGIAVFFALSSSYLCQQVAIAQLTFESDNRSSGIRLTVTAQWLIGWLAILGYVALFKSSFADMNIYVMVTLTSIFLTIAGLFVIAEADGLSRRVGAGAAAFALDAGGLGSLPAGWNAGIDLRIGIDWPHDRARDIGDESGNQDGHHASAFDLAGMVGRRGHDRVRCNLHGGRRLSDPALPHRDDEFLAGTSHCALALDQSAAGSTGIPLALFIELSRQHLPADRHCLSHRDDQRHHGGPHE